MKKNNVNICLNTKYLNTQETAYLLGLSKGTLQNMRVMRRGPPYIKIGGSVRYDSQDLHQFMESRKVLKNNAQK